MTDGAGDVSSASCMSCRSERSAVELRLGHLALERADRSIELADLDELPLAKALDHSLESVEEVLELVPLA